MGGGERGECERTSDAPGRPDSSSLLAGMGCSALTPWRGPLNCRACWRPACRQLPHEAMTACVLCRPGGGNGSANVRGRGACRYAPAHGTSRHSPLPTAHACCSVTVVGPAVHASQHVSQHALAKHTHARVGPCTQSPISPDASVCSCRALRLASCYPALYALRRCGRKLCSAPAHVT